MVMIMVARLLSKMVGKEKVIGVDITGAAVRSAVDKFNSCDSFIRVSHGGRPHPSFEKYYLNPDWDEAKWIEEGSLCEGEPEPPPLRQHEKGSEPTPDEGDVFTSLTTEPKPEPPEYLPPVTPDAVPERAPESEPEADYRFPPSRQDEEDMGKGSEPPEG
jgi:hypothetical protein